MSNIGNLLSIGFTIVLILLSSTFSIALVDNNRRRYFSIIAGILTGIAVGFMVGFIIGGIFFPEPPI